MTHSAGPAGGQYGASHSAAYSAHAAAARQLRKEAVVLWLIAAGLLATGLLWCEGLSSYALLIAAAWTAWSGAFRTLHSVGEGFKATLSDGSIAGHSAENMFQKAQFWWWLGPGCKVDFRNRSGQWVRGQVKRFPCPWYKAEVQFVAATGKNMAEWVWISEQRLLYPGQVTTAQEHQHRVATPQGELSGTISTQLLERSQRSANADPQGHTPTSSRLDGLRDGGGYADSPGFSISGAVSPGFSPYGGSSGAPSPAPGFAGTPGGPMRSPGPSLRGAFSAQQSPMRPFASPMSVMKSPASALGATLNASGHSARIFDDITNEAELRQYEDSHPLESTVRRASFATSPGRADGTLWGRSPSPVRGASLQRSSIGGVDGYTYAGDAIQEYHAGEVRTSGQTTTGRASSSGGGIRQTIESPDALIPRLASECSHQPSPWSRNPQEDILRWSWQVQRWLEVNLIQFVGRHLFDTDFLTMARGPHHAKAKPLFCEQVRSSLDTDQLGRQVPSEFNRLWNEDQALHQVKGIGELTIHELMRQQAPANSVPGMGGMLMNAGGMLGMRRKSSVGSSGGDDSLLDYICMRLPRQGKRLRELQRQQLFLDSHGLSDSKNSRAVFIVQRLKTLGAISVPKDSIAQIHFPTSPIAEAVKLSMVHSTHKLFLWCTLQHNARTSGTPAMRPHLTLGTVDSMTITSGSCRTAQLRIFRPTLKFCSSSSSRKNLLPRWTLNTRQSVGTWSPCKMAAVLRRNIYVAVATSQTGVRFSQRTASTGCTSRLLLQKVLRTPHCRCGKSLQGRATCLERLLSSSTT